MKYGMHTCVYSQIGSFVPAYPLQEVFKRLSRIGYDGIELPCSAPDAWPYYLNDEKIRQIDGWQKEYKVKIFGLMVCPGGSPGGNMASMCDEERNWTIQYAKDVVDLAVAWGANIVSVIPGWTLVGTRRKDGWTRSVDSIRQVAQYALSKNDKITLCIENTAEVTNLIDRIDETLELIEEINLPNIGVMFDTAHSFFRLEEAADWAYTAGKYLKHIHLADKNRQAPGTSGYDFRPLMQALKDISYEGYVTMEIGFSRDRNPDSMSRQALEYLKNLEAKLL